MNNEYQITIYDLPYILVYLIGLCIAFLVGGILIPVCTNQNRSNISVVKKRNKMKNKMIK